MRIYKIQKKNEPSDFEIITKGDPNGTGLFQIKIEYKAIYEDGRVRVLEIDHKTLPEGLEFKSGMSGVSNNIVEIDITLKNSTDKEIVINESSILKIFQTGLSFLRLWYREQ